MSSPPWEADRELSLSSASAAIRRAFPQVDASELVLLGSGWEFDAYLTRDNWVVRFPRRAEYASLFDSEVQVHRLVSAALTGVAQVPRVELRGDPGPEFPYAFGAHRYIPGISADTLHDELLPALATSIGTALSLVHSIPATSARAGGITEFDRDADDVRTWLEWRLSILAEADLKPPHLQAAVAWVRDLAFPIEPYRGPLRLIHHDLSPEHLIVGPDSGALVGIIDWTDAILGDPVRDFVIFVACWGWDFTHDVLRSYAAPTDDEFLDRLRLLARFLSVMWLSEAIELGSDFDKHANWVRNAFA